ncbi:hypothetical protein [Lacipirellula parvula]|uniref:Uncharacterized protein n=1 Tax=Lacipirellula parvula TaxID=2650471 RepID=A0A5K7X7Z3_9BACT|nr:hypothetical protein [Lacipirellula parvula]BBO32505.1 hypothetical protein PLANPX_2117 [Lacipirellula parvula]
MVLDTRFNLIQDNRPSRFNRGCVINEGVMFVDGERVADYRVGVDTPRDAVNRHLAKKATPAKPAAPVVDKGAKAKQLAAQQAADAVKIAELKKLSQDIDELKTQVDASEAKANPRKGIRMSQGSFRPFGTKPAA